MRSGQPPLIDHYMPVLSGGSVSTDPSISGTHHDCQTIIQYDDHVSNGPCDRGQKVITTNRPTTCACCRVVPFLMARSYREPMTEAKRLLNAMIPFLTARAIGTITASDHYIRICLCFRMALFLTTRSSGEPTTIAKRLFPKMIPFLTAPAIEDKQ